VQVLTVNAGSSSVKLRMLDDDDSVVGSTDLAVDRGQVDEVAVQKAVADFATPDAVGHRIVHGGQQFREPVRLDDEVVEALRKLTDLAPLHQPKSLAALDAVSKVLPEVPGVACFDTAFHSTLPTAAATYALPEEWRNRHALRRYGFHGLSHAYASRRAGELLGRADLRLVTCHLGAGASLAAVRNGKSVDTTMGFTPLEGLVMATRSGSVDPGMLLWLLERQSLTVAEMAHALEHDSGLFGLARTADMREVLELSQIGDDRAQLARNVYLHRLCAGIASMTAALGGIDGLVFTGGVGENSADIRARAIEGLAFLGLSVDPTLNIKVAGDRIISPDGIEPTTLVILAREEIQIAHEVRRVLDVADQANLGRENNS
jgi:acetate kinase